MLNLDIEKTKKKWGPILDSLEVNDPTKREVMSIYAEYHMLIDGILYTSTSHSGIGAVKSTTLNETPFNDYPSKNKEIKDEHFRELMKKWNSKKIEYSDDSNIGSPLVQQNLLPVSMKALARIKNKHVMLTSSPRYVFEHPITKEIITKQIGDVEIVYPYTIQQIEEIEKLEHDNCTDISKLKTFDEIEEPKLIDRLIEYINNSEHNVILIYMLINDISIKPSNEFGIYNFILRSRYCEWTDPYYPNNFID